MQNEYPRCTIKTKSKNFLTVFKYIGKNNKKVTETRDFLY
ncbi:Uncharacterized protein FWK35_00025642 [Aphis craccivora]|uniref:Uncharacterized protein n=1 Tax=Aphis craccivora TaxID=307492 RepID=A0A6G0Z5U4_APHCR|nr:Uncharacterized protein FWK35_00025642 [Aphis craccivora]